MTRSNVIPIKNYAPHTHTCRSLGEAPHIWNCDCKGEMTRESALCPVHKKQFDEMFEEYAQVSKRPILKNGRPLKTS